MKLPRLSGSELAAALRQLGYRITRQSGSHLRLTTQRKGEHHATIPLHRSLKAGTARAVPRDVAKYHGLTCENYWNSFSDASSIDISYEPLVEIQLGAQSESKGFPNCAVNTRAVNVTIMPAMKLLILPLTLALFGSFLSCQPEPEATKREPGIRLEIEQITQGPRNHFFGYIGHVQNIPWNGSGRYLLSLRVGFHDRMPTADDAADIVLLDAENRYAVRKVEETRAWNPQQGTMMYWNPEAPDTQFFFNDRDPATNRVFCVLFDMEQNRRVREYRFDDTPFGNGGVKQNGGSFAGINYGRMARLRPVTGYPEAYDWNPGALHPEDDGVFVADVETGAKRLLVSFRQMRDALVERYPRIGQTPLFINHTLWNRDGDRLYFFVRGNFNRRPERVNVPMTVRADGSGLTEQRVFIGGHPEWELGANMIGTVPLSVSKGSTPEDDGEQRLVLYDSENQKIIQELGSSEIFPDPGNDVALSPDAKWIVQGFEEEARNAYAVYRRSDGAWAHTPWFDQRQYDSGPLRIDSAPKWNRSNDQILFSSLTDEPEPTRQLFLIRVKTND